MLRTAALLALIASPAAAHGTGFAHAHPHGAEIWLAAALLVVGGLALRRVLK